MSELNKNNPTLNWDEDEQYEFAKWENNWVKEMPLKHVTKRLDGRSYGRVGDYLQDPVFSSVEELNMTFKKDIETRQNAWAHLCQICDYATNERSNLTGHIRYHSEEEFSCTICNGKFRTKDNLTKHVKRVHMDEKVNCQICNKLFKSMYLKDHIKTVHGEKRFQCEECPKIFTTNAHLQHHYRTVHVLKALKCPECKVRFRNKGSLKVLI